jgi:hypothetical protein
MDLTTLSVVGGRRSFFNTRHWQAMCLSFLWTRQRSSRGLLRFPQEVVVDPDWICIFFFM